MNLSHAIPFSLDEIMEAMPHKLRNAENVRKVLKVWIKQINIATTMIAQMGARLDVESINGRVLDIEAGKLNLTRKEGESDVELKLRMKDAMLTFVNDGTITFKSEQEMTDASSGLLNTQSKNVGVIRNVGESDSDLIFRMQNEVESATASGNVHSVTTLVNKLLKLQKSKLYIREIGNANIELFIDSSSSEQNTLERARKILAQSKPIGVGVVITSTKNIEYIDDYSTRTEVITGDFAQSKRALTSGVKLTRGNKLIGGYAGYRCIDNMSQVDNIVSITVKDVDDFLMESEVLRDPLPLRDINVIRTIVRKYE